MSASPEPFDDLRRLLALKRYEQPPPDFFNDLNDRVMERLIEAAPPASAWWHRLWTSLDPRPLLAGAYVTAICGLLATGFSLSATFDQDTPSEPWLAESTLQLESWSTPPETSVFGETRVEGPLFSVVCPALRLDPSRNSWVGWLAPTAAPAASITRFERLAEE